MRGPVTVLWLLALATVVGHLIFGDLRDRRLANRSVLAFIALALVGVLGAGVVATDAARVGVGIALAAGAGVLAIGLALWAAGLVGGGDVKVAPAVVALVTRFGSDAWLVHLGVMILVGGATAIWWLLRRSDGEDGLPLGPTLLAGVVPAMAVVVLTA